MLAARDLTAPYGLAPGLDLVVSTGERVGLVGPNGAGKSTLVKCFAGCLRPTSGEVHLDGRPLTGRPRQEVARSLAVVPQTAAFEFDFTVYEAVAMGRLPHRPRLKGLREVDHRAVADALDRADLGAFRDRSVRTLSGGEQQRGLIARARAQTPRCLLLDEPTAHLDLAHAADLVERLVALNEADGLTVVCVLHDRNLAALYFPRLVLLAEGRVVADGTPEEVLPQVAEVYAAEVHLVPHPDTSTPQVLMGCRRPAHRS